MAEYRYCEMQQNRHSWSLSSLGEGMVIQHVELWYPKFDEVKRVLAVAALLRIPPCDMQQTVSGHI